MLSTPWWSPRKLRSRTQLAIAILLLLFFALGSLASWFTLRDSFDQFERSSINQDLARLELWLREEMESLRRSSNDYAFWDDTYEYTLGSNPDYAAENIVDEVFNNLDIDAFVVITTDNQIHHASARSSNRDGEIELVPLKEELAYWLRERPILNDVQQSLEAKAVINHLYDTPILIAAAPILHSDNSGPSVGTLLMLRILSPRRLEIDDPLRGKAWELFESREVVPTGILQQDNLLQITRKLDVFSDHADNYLRLSSEAQLQQQFTTAIQLSSSNMALMGIATLLLLGVVLNRLVLNRVLFFSRRADEIRSSGDLALRIPHSNHDELDHLAQTVNEMLDELQQANLQLYHDSLHDPLTGLGNRALLNDRLTYTLKLSRIEEETFALMIIDLDGFKDINDLHGHAAGDAILSQTAIKLINWCGPADTAVRLGGDEFAVIRILSSDCGQTLTEEANTLRTALSYTHQWERERLPVSASIGIAISNHNATDETASDLLRNADTALYRAKEEGRDRVRIFSPDMRQLLFERMTLMQELQDAINNDTLLLHFQPIIDRHDKPYSVEALVRWPHPERGLIPPDRFIPIAEKSLLITRLDLWVLKSACAALSRMRKTAPQLCVTINCSARTLLEEDVAGILLAELEHNNLPPSSVHVELTETALARNESEMVPILEKLVVNDVRIYLDDFGTGYSSLHRLHMLPFHHLKVDRSFVKRLDKGDETITRTIIQLAKSLNKSVVVEGVETENQLAILKRLEADYMQGFLFSRPLPEGELIDWLSQH